LIANGAIFLPPGKFTAPHLRAALDYCGFSRPGWRSNFGISVKTATGKLVAGML